MAGPYDVIVVGARCAGAPTAMLLARRGCRVLLVDRSRFPSNIAHGHFIHRHGPRRLHDWGLLEALIATGCPPVTTITLDDGDFPLTGHDLMAAGVAAGYGPRRGVLDKLLIDAAVAAGAEMREGFAVEDYVVDGDRVTGIRGRDHAGSLVTERATITIGADGRDSRLARTVQAADHEFVPTVACWYFSYWADAAVPGLELYVRGERAIFTHPTNDGLSAIFVGWPIANHSVVRADVEGEFMTAVDCVPELAGRLRAGRRAERFYGAANLPNVLRKPFGPGWALVGDAGCHKDPYLALGICDALRDADLLAEAIDAGLSGRQPLDAAMESYEQRRNAATMADFRLNLDLAQFKPPDAAQRRLRQVLRGNQEATRRFLMAREDMIPRETFFNPRNLRSLLRELGAVAR